jgi:hypothetical protein
MKSSTKRYLIQRAEELACSLVVEPFESDVELVHDTLTAVYEKGRLDGIRFLQSIINLEDPDED